jgi:glycosyltransferase involved in cell wall biosynthesis
MKLSAFTYVRNGNTYGYPFVESIQSLLPLVDEYIVVVGDSTDGTREAVANIGSEKIKIVDTVWDETLREGGKVFAQQANIGFDNCSKNADWLFHLQADEVIHENDLPLIRKTLEDNISTKGLDGFLLRFIHFYGDYRHYCPSRRFHQREIRIVRNSPHIRSYKDSMGFRKYSNPDEKGDKLFVKQMNVPVYHYSWARPPKKMKAKQIEFARKYIATDDFVKDFEAKMGDEYGYREYDYLEMFTGSHPGVMKSTVAAQDWGFEYDPAKNNMSFKEKLLKLVEKLTGKQIFIYKNYRLF